MNPALLDSLGMTSVVLGFATCIGMLATMLHNQTAGDRLTWVMLTTVTGIGFLTSLLILVGAQS